MRRGFTLVELLIVIAILGILSSLVTAKTLDARDKARIARGQVFERNLLNVLALSSVGEWTFDGGTGTEFQDSSGEENDGTGQGGITVVNDEDDCVFKSCILFDGVDDWVQISSSESISGLEQITIMFWVQVLDWTSGERIIYKDGEYSVHLSTEGDDETITFDTFGDSIECGTRGLKPNAWHHIAIAWVSGDSFTMFVDGGLEKCSGETTEEYVDTGNQLAIGQTGFGANFFEGYLDQVRIYDGTTNNTTVAEGGGGPNELPTPSDAGRSPVNTYNYEGGNEYDVKLSMSAWVDPDGDDLEYYFERFSDTQNCSGSPSENSGWISDPTSADGWTIHILDEQYNAWRVKARDGVGSETGWNTCFWLDNWYGSCPLLYVQNEDGTYTYITDMANGVLGLRDDRFAKYYERSHFFIPNQPKDGEYVIKIRELYDEIGYVDDIKLMLIDHDEDVEIVHTGQQSAVQGPSEYKIFTVTDPKLPTRVLNKSGEDVTGLFTSIDNLVDEVNLYSDDYWDLTFEGIEGKEHAKLLLDTWTYTSNPNEQASHVFEDNTLPYIEVKNTEGEWEKVLEFPYGTADMRQATVELGDIFLSEDRTIRLHTGKYHPLSDMLIDRIRYDESEPQDYTITEMSPKSATLKDGGMANFVEATLDSRSVVGDESFDPGELKYYGYYTKYGDVLPLVTEQDDMYVVMRKADQLDLTFEEPKKSEQDRTVIVSSKTWFKINKSQNHTNEYPDPLPFSGMSAYPYDTTVENYPQDREHTLYIEEWNTRYYPEPEEEVEFDPHRAQLGDRVLGIMNELAL